jgi:iron complex outermembrane recepter protein
MNFLDEYVDQRTAPYLPNVSYSQTPGSPVTVLGGKVIEATQTFDLTYRWAMENDLVVTAGVENITDQDPSFARLELNYDPFTGNPLGRTFKLGIKKSFGG